jgi:phosphomannomutase / phosphoglucomutase
MLEKLSKHRFSSNIQFAIVVNSIFLLIAGFLLCCTHVLAPLHTQQRALASQGAQTIAASVRAAADQWQLSLQQLSNHPDTLAALQTQDKTATVAVETRIRAHFPNATAVLLIPKNAAGDDNPALGFAGLDMIHRANKGERVSPEIHLFGTPNQYISLIQPVLTPQKEIVGFVFVKASMALLQNSLNSFQQLAGHIQLQQTFANTKPQIIAQLGSVKFPPSSTNASAVAIPNWQVVYWPNSTHGTFLLTSFFWLIIFTVMLVSAAVLYFVHMCLNIKLYHDIRALITFLEQPATERNFPTFLLDIFTDGLTTHVHAGQAERGAPTYKIPAFKRVKPATPAKPAAEKKPTPPSPTNDSTTDVMFQQQNAIQFELIEKTDVISPTIFRAYDIRGTVPDEISSTLAHDLGMAIASEAAARGETHIAVARDGRHSSPELGAALMHGIISSGLNVYDVGTVPTPVLYFATHQLPNTTSGVMITGSHNPANYNGFKIVLKGKTLAEAEIQALYQRLINRDLLQTDQTGTIEQQDLLANYMTHALKGGALTRRMKVVVDAGNGIAGRLAPRLLRRLGAEVVELYCDVDGNFPNHHPDPSKPENLKDLIKEVKTSQAELGLAFDGDGDRLGVVTNEGRIIWPDRQMMLYATDVLARKPGSTIVFDVKCTRHLAKIIENAGGKPLMARTGHSLIKATLQETQAALAGEMSGHIFFNDDWFGFDDGLYTAVRLLQLIDRSGKSLSALCRRLPDSLNTPELQVAIADTEKFSFIEQLKAKSQFGNAKLITIDGLRVEFPDSWGLVRASNTMPMLVLRFEADNANALEHVQDLFKQQMLAVRPDLELPF